MDISLTDPEHQLLVALLEKEIQDIRSETYHAESHRVKEMLKEREALVRGILTRLQSQEPRTVSHV